jgi:hypothetical protein
MAQDSVDLMDENPSDPETELILDFLADRLPPEDARAMEDRARRDKRFRNKLADMTLLKGIVMLALERSEEEPARPAKECRRIRKLLRAYHEGRTRPAQTAELSSHVDECLDCENALEEISAAPRKINAHAGWWTRCRLAVSHVATWVPWRRAAGS